MTSGSDILVEECVEASSEARSFGMATVIRLAPGQGEATGHVASLPWWWGMGGLVVPSPWWCRISGRGFVLDGGAGAGRQRLTAPRLEGLSGKTGASRAIYRP